ncbi:MAG TPA: DUF2273 domain-containing protein [Firmicutes bacterium]|jgi:uncharacterized membrane protein|nr:DUF2273 domain-containing protein [Bacillota bacterium]
MSNFFQFLAQLAPYRGRIIGTIFGLFVGILILKYGFFRALVVAIFISLGYYLGLKMDRRETLSGLWERLWRNRDG